MSELLTYEDIRSHGRSDSSWDSQHTQNTKKLGVGCIVQDYIISALLGKGGVSSVFQASALCADNPQPTIAIKVTPQTSQIPRGHQDLLTESRLTAQASHPNLPTVYGYGVVNGEVYTAMEMVDGWNLKQLLSRVGPLPMSVAISLALQICEGLAHLHEKCPNPLIHCDLKLANIMVTKAGQVKMIDLGVAWPIGKKWLKEAPVYGTPAYMAPEQVMKLEPTAATDVYSLGAVLYELVSGRRLFEETDVLKLVQDRVDSWCAPFSTVEFQPTTSKLFDAIVRRCTSSRPARRYTNVGEVMQCLRVLQKSIAAGPMVKEFLEERAGTEPLAMAG